MAKSKTEVKNPLELTKYIVIEPYADPERYNGGFEKSGFSGEPTAPLNYEIASTNQTGSNRVLCGLDAHGVDVIKCKNEEERAAKVKLINDTLDYLEKKHKISREILDAQNIQFWKSPEMRLHLTRGQGTTLDKDNWRHLCLYYAIKAGGIPEIAPSYEEAVKMAKMGAKVTHYLYVKEEVDAAKSSPIVERAMLITELGSVYQSDTDKLFYLAVNALPASKEFRFKTTPKALFAALIEYIEAKDDQKILIKKRLEEMNALLKMGIKELKLRAMVKMGEYLRYIRKPKDSEEYFDIQTGEPMGKNLKQVLDFLDNPINDKVYQYLEEKLKDYWSK
jgi:hypothetical protein